MSADQADKPIDNPNESDPVLTLGQKRFYASAQCSEARIALKQMVDNPAFDTDSEYFRGSTLAFVDRHLHYLSTHPTTNLIGYLSNLRLMTRAGRK